MSDLISRLRSLSRPGGGGTIGNEAADEIERLTQALKKANDQAEHFEREWYLRGDEIEHLQLCIRDLNGILNEKRDEIERLRADAERWQTLYRRAINEANGLTNYVEDRPELRRAERNIVAIEAAARAALKETT